MLNDVTPPDWQRPKPKHLEPLAKPVSRPLHELAAAEDPSFKTPEQIAAKESAEQVSPTIVHHQAPSERWYRRFVPRTRRQKIVAGTIAVLVAFGAGAGWTLTHHKRTVVAVPPHKAITKPAPPPTPIYSTLSGLPVADASVNQRPVTGVMVENSLDARPQSGLSQAGVVFEAVAEGGVTRFLALYQDQQPTNVGPIRSARPYYVQWDMGFDAPYAHVGGSDDALNDIKAWGVKDMNQFYNGGYYHRISSRAAPHNVYTGIDTLAQLEGGKGWGTSTFTGFSRKSDQPYKPTPAGQTATDTRTPASSLDFSLSGYTYDPHYDYDAGTNSYKRSEAGEAQTDANTGQQLAPKVVIAIVVPESQGALDSTGAYYSNYNVIGSGQAYIFQDGTVTTGQWQKPDNGTNISFTDANGQPLALNRGQTWISAVTASSRVSYK